MVPRGNHSLSYLVNDQIVSLGHLTFVVLHCHILQWGLWPVIILQEVCPLGKLLEGELHPSLSHGRGFQPIVIRLRISKPCDIIVRENDVAPFHLLGLFAQVTMDL